MGTRPAASSWEEHRYRKPWPRPARLDRWSLQYGKPPYRVLEDVPSELGLLSKLGPALEPPRGPLLIATPATLDPTDDFKEIDWLRETLPWMALLVVVPDPAQTDPLGRRINHLARRGAIVVPRELGDASDLASAVRQSSDLRLDLPPWLAAVLPGWPTGKRLAAVGSFLDGFQYDPEEFLASHPGSRLPSRGTSWVQVGRATRAALRIQTRRAESWRMVSLEAGFSNLKAMDRAMLRTFGIPRQEIAGTAGWEWLIWRFVCGLGTGKARDRGQPRPKRESSAGFGP